MDLRANLANARSLAKTYGPRYAIADVGWRAARRVTRQLEDALLELEGARGVIGPAHSRWSDHSTSENRRRWNEWDWSSRGEEWNESAEWKAALVDDVLLRVIPEGGTVVEIGPGAGRWSVFLAPRAERLIVVDVAQKALDAVADRLGDARNVEYVLSNGTSLTGVQDGTVDAVWSFDVFVHIRPRDQEGYLAEVARVLRPGGVAAIHHSDGRNRGRVPSREGWRAPMTVTLFAAVAREHGLEVDRHIREWGGGRHGLDPFHDAITVLRRPG